MRWANLSQLDLMRTHSLSPSIPASPCRQRDKLCPTLRGFVYVGTLFVFAALVVPLHASAEDTSFAAGVWSTMPRTPMARSKVAAEMFVPPSSQTPQGSKGRASSKQVGAVMALLATFEDARALPPESSPDANRLIKALIQFQAAFMKSTDPVITQLLTDALAMKLGDQAPAGIARFHSSGWTSESLEALVDFINDHKSWQHSDVRMGFRPYNVGEEDFALLAHTFVTARRHLAAQGHNLHTVYASRRREMPGAGS